MTSSSSTNLALLISHSKNSKNSKVKFVLNSIIEITTHKSLLIKPKDLFEPLLSQQTKA